MTPEEHNQAFKAFIKSVKYDFMYMGKDSEYFYFKHATTRKGIQIPIEEKNAEQEYLAKLDDFARREDKYIKKMERLREEVGS